MICVNKAVICACIFNFSVSSQDPKLNLHFQFRHIKSLEKSSALLI